MNKYTRMNWENTPSTATPLNADNLNHMDEGIEQATDGVIAVEENLKTATADLTAVKSEVETARGEYDNLDQRLDGIDTTVGNKADKSTVSQLSARLQSAETSLTNKANAADVNNALKVKEDSSNKVDDKSQITDSTKNYPSIEYLNNYYNDMTESYSAEETDSLLDTKYDAANIESGTSTLTPYSTVTDKIKSATCTYKTVGDVVLIDVDIVMNAVSMGASSAYVLIDLPYKNSATIPKYFVGISSNNKLLKGSIPKNSTWLQFSLQDKVAYTFTDGEQINFSLLYKIK